MADGYLKQLSYTNGFEMFRAWLEEELKCHEQAIVEDLARRHEKILRNLSELQEEAGLSEKVLFGPASQLKPLRKVGQSDQSRVDVTCGALKSDSSSSLQGKPYFAIGQPRESLCRDNSQISVSASRLPIDHSRLLNREYSSQKSLEISHVSGKITNVKSQHAIAKEFGTSFKEHRTLGNTAEASLLSIAHNRVFEVTSFVAILINALLIACEQQYVGMETGYEIGFYGSSPKDYWASGETFFEVCELLMFVFFIGELMLRLIAATIEFGRTTRNTICWLIFDALLMGFDACLRFNIFHIKGLRPSVFRMMRLLRMLRLVKLFSRFDFLDSLILLVRSLCASVSALLWSFTILLLLQILLAIIMGVIIEQVIQDGSLDYEDQMKVYELYGTFSRGLITNFEISLANWGPVCRFLMDAVSEWFIVFFLLYSCMLSFAIVRVISAVFIAETNRILLFDEDLGIRLRNRSQKKHQRQFDNILSVLPVNPDGTTQFTKQQLTEALSGDEMQARLGAMDISPHDLDALFDILDDLNPDNGDGLVDNVDFIKGMALVKGHARSLDLMYLRLQMNALMECLPALLLAVDEVRLSQGEHDKALLKMKSNVHPVDIITK